MLIVSRLNFLYNNIIIIQLLLMVFLFSKFLAQDNDFPAF